MNEGIRFPEVRLIGSDGSQVGVVSVQDALRRAREEGLDLVEVAAQSRPPVCRIMDFGKFKYQEAKKRQEAKKHQTVIHIKEIKLRPATDIHDLEIKIKHIREFLEEGDKVKITIRFRGRELAHRNLGEEKLKQVIAAVADLAKVEATPKFEHKTIFTVIAPLGKPVKATKKGGAKPKSGEQNAKVEKQPRGEKTV